MIVFSFVTLFATIFPLVCGHGYLYEPVARSSAWLVDPSFKECCSYANHMEMFCGGIGRQWKVNDGKCSICGEPYDATTKLFEKGGSLYKGKIVKTYSQGQIINVQVMLTANHKGYFEFRLCSLDASPQADATQECLDRHLLKVVETGTTKTNDVGIYGSSMISVLVQLPSNVACKHCVFQWKYTAANSWGTDPVTGETGPGRGKENETFMGCSDIAIVSDGTPTSPPSVIIPTQSTIRTSTSSIVQTWWPQTSSTPQTTQTWWPQTSSTPYASTTNTQPATTSTSRVPLGLTTWSGDLIQYEEGDIVVYDGIKYRCVAPHRSFFGAEPSPLTWAWWKQIDE